MSLDAVFATAARYLTRAAVLFLAAMMMITVVDIPLRAVNLPIFGTFDLVELFLVAMVYLAIPETFLRREHVVVEVLDQVIGERLRPVFETISTGLALVLLVLMEIHMVEPALDMYAFGDETKDLEIPKIVHWVPILLGVACSMLAVALLFLRDVVRLAGAVRGR